MRISRFVVPALVALAGAAWASVPAAAENIAVSNYGISANGMPFAVALAKGSFREGPHCAT